PQELPSSIPNLASTHRTLHLCHSDRSKPAPFLRVRFVRTRRLAQWRNPGLISTQPPPDEIIPLLPTSILFLVTPLLPRFFTSSGPLPIRQPAAHIHALSRQKTRILPTGWEGNPRDDDERPAVRVSIRRSKRTRRNRDRHAR